MVVPNQMDAEINSEACKNQRPDQALQAFLDVKRCVHPADESCRESYVNIILQKTAQKLGRTRYFATMDALPAYRPLVTKLGFNPQKLIILRHPVRPGQRSGFDLAAVCRDREVGNDRVLSLAGAVRHDGPIPGSQRH